jgi:uncharacterized protein YjbJ (UPF0337 family)
MQRLAAPSKQMKKMSNVRPDPACRPLNRRGVLLSFRVYRKKQGDLVMASGKSDDVKGRLKEAAGVLTGDKKMQREGKADQVAGKVKNAVEKVKDKADQAIDELKDSLS